MDTRYARELMRLWPFASGGRANRIYQPGTPLLQRLLSLLLISLRQLNASVERVKHTLELVKGRERLQSAREGRLT